MNRRGFLAALAAIVDPERLLWVPGKKLISIPSPQIKTGYFLFNGKKYPMYSMKFEPPPEIVLGTYTDICPPPPMKIRFINHKSAIG